ncbi:hypothetical protein [Phenylobacterium sp.]|uniref:hypothetical protein n=1 Tax=Phenylobacterium sp. TaxID=1871053 RepID=UPI002FDB2AC0
MSDPEAPPGETPMQRALRLKKAAQAARSQPPGGRSPRDPAGARSAARSKPWMTR